MLVIATLTLAEQTRYLAWDDVHFDLNGFPTADAWESLYDTRAAIFGVIPVIQKTNGGESKCHGVSLGHHLSHPTLR